MGSIEQIHFESILLSSTITNSYQPGGISSPALIRFLSNPGAVCLIYGMPPTPADLWIEEEEREDKKSNKFTLNIDKWVVI